MKTENKKPDLSHEEAHTQILAYVNERAAQMYAAQDRRVATSLGNEGCYLKVDKGWALDAELMVKLRIEDIKRGYAWWRVETQVTWGSAYRTPAQALAAAEIYRQLALLGIEIEERWNRYLIGESIEEAKAKRGVPSKVPGQPDPAPSK